MAGEERWKSGVICIDLDGTLLQFVDELNMLGVPIPGAKEAVEHFRSMGYKIVVHTARPEEQYAIILEHLQNYGIIVEAVNSNLDGRWVTTKPVADLYIDDRALRFRGSWSSTVEEARGILRPNY